MEEEKVVTDETLEVTEDQNEELTKAQELAKNQKIRAEKAEAELKKLRSEPKEEKSVPQGDDLSPKEWMFIAKADVHEDDIDRVVKFSKLEGISVQEALKHSDLKAILASRAEARKSAEATSIKSARIPATKISPEVIVEKAKKGDIPAKGSAEAEELFWARRGGRRG